MDRLSLMECFTRVVETGSFSAVARELRIGQPNISRNIAALERHLGVRLLHRSTRKLTLTPEGERYYAEARRILDATQEAESNARGEDRPRGLLRVACPTALGRTHVLPRIATFLAQYPELRLELQIGDRFVDLVEEGIDVAIRIGMLKDSALKARRIGLGERVCVASPAYLARRPAPRVPEDLVHHDCILYAWSMTGNTWTFHGHEVAIGGRFTVNNPDGVYSAVLDGLGVGNAPVWLFDRALADGRVVALLLDYPSQAAPIHLVYPAQRLLPLRARVFMDYIAEAFRVDPSVNEGGIQHILQNVRG
ncbi:MAG: LysR family transcriptional regulator [Gammaproteobacteria bacterium]|nr:LysR family transcriptional regulator [Gammaproteobacteria bacterium]